MNTSEPLNPYSEIAAALLLAALVIIGYVVFAVGADQLGADPVDPDTLSTLAEHPGTLDQRIELVALGNRNAQLEAEVATLAEAIRQRLNGTTLSLAELDALWHAGYRSGGGNNPDHFTNIILPCESGGETFPHDAIGPTGDHGRAQINARTWAETFEHRYGIDFTDGVYDPVLNGHMAAHIEHVQGLSAWACHR